MKNIVTLSVIASSLVLSLQASDNIFTNAKVSGQARMFYIDREYQGSAGNKIHRGSTAIGGYLKYDTASWQGLSLGTAFYTTNEIHSRRTMDQTLFGPNNENITYVGEAYLNYKYQNTNFKAGRQKLVTPMLGDDDGRMLPNLFEAYVLSNSDIKGLNITLAHITKEAQGTFGRVYDASTPAGAVLSVTSGYSYVDTQNYAGKFRDVGRYAFGKNTDGITMLGLTYTGLNHLKFDLYNYYAYDIANILYAEGLADWKCLISDSISPYLGVQYIKEDSVGDEIAKEIDSNYIAAKLGFKVANFDLMFAYSHTGSNDNPTTNPLQKAIITPWGGMSAYTQGMVTRHQFMAGVDAKKVALSYNSKDLGLNLTSIGYYTSFEMDGKSGYGMSRDTHEAGFDFIYVPQEIKNLNIRFRGNFPRSYAKTQKGTTGWNEYRFIVNYNF